jgi:hypothetical protein
MPWNDWFQCGSCLKCGAPIWGRMNEDPKHPPITQFSCSCREDITVKRELPSWPQIPQQPNIVPFTYGTPPQEPGLTAMNSNPPNFD